MASSCSKNASSSSKFSKKYSESNHSVYSETSPDTKDFNHSDKEYENDISTDLSP